MSGKQRRPSPGAVPDPREERIAVPEDDGLGAGKDPSPQQEQSSYHAAPPGRPGPEPLKVRIELVLVSDPEGKQLRMRQAAAIREALRWFAEHPNPRQNPGPS
jgi:hypothetical protein